MSIPNSYSTINDQDKAATTVLLQGLVKKNINLQEGKSGRAVKYRLKK
jgi:hypothetical protein